MSSESWRVYVPNASTTLQRSLLHGLHGERRHLEGVAAGTQEPGGHALRGLLDGAAQDQSRLDVLRELQPLGAARLLLPQVEAPECVPDLARVGRRVGRHLVDLPTELLRELDAERDRGLSTRRQARARACASPAPRREGRNPLLP
jgi:hypothetical protein